MAGGSNLSGMKVNIDNLVKAINDLDRRSEERDKASQDFRERMIGGIATINEKLETANQSQIKNMEYQAACEAERRIHDARINVLETTQDEHTKTIESNRARLGIVENFQSRQKGAWAFAIASASFIGACLGFIADFFMGRHS